MALPIDFDAKTDVGRKRKHNEDNFFVDKSISLFAVADGMGGHAAGEVASGLAVHSFHEELRKHDDLLGRLNEAEPEARLRLCAVLSHCLEHASARIYREAAEDGAKRGMGTTFSALLLRGRYAFIVHVGDSRVYLLRGGEVQQLTEDHTVVNELLRRGKITPEQAADFTQKNAITRAVGVYERVEVDTLAIEVLPGDQFLLCSDGLAGYLSSTDEITAAFESVDTGSVTTRLIALANERGGKDNITTVAVRVAAGESDEARAKRFEKKKALFARVPIFSSLSEREMLRIIQIVTIREYEPGAVVIREGSAGDELFVVLQGALSVHRSGQVLSELGEGQHVGEMALIRNVPRSATVESIGRSELAVIRRSDFFKLLKGDADLTTKLLWQIVGVLADRLEQTSVELSHTKQELLEIVETREVSSVTIQEGLSSFEDADTAEIEKARP